MWLIDQRADRYLRAPRWSVAAGGVRLHVVAWEPDGERILTFEMSTAGGPRLDVEPTAGERQEAIANLTPTSPPGPSDDPADEHRARDGDWQIEVRRQGYRSTVVATLPSGGEATVWRAWGTAAAPAVAATAGGAWVAFHHNVREDDGRADLAKWIALRFVGSDGTVLEPAAPMTGRDRDLGGEEQSFEFPTLWVGEDGAVALFGRGSHCFWRQDLSAGGFSERRPLGDGSSWGCRGRRVAVISPPQGGPLLTARRERKGIVVEEAAPPSGGAPALGRATVEIEGRPPTPIGSPGPDPAERDGRRTLFGDIHQHSAHSDGIGAADEPYLRARHVYGDDFCALTDHESFLGKRIGPGEWAYLQQVAENHDDPGRFATLVAYEWTGKMHPGPGHKVVYLPEAGRPIVSRDEVPGGADLVRAAQEMGGFAVPHHVGWTGADEPGHDPRGQPVWEICSCHGCYESFAHVLGQRGDLRDQMVDAVLQRGLRFGFIACSDGHGLLWHHGVGRKRDPFRTGLTAVQARECTRGAILEAIRERRCYATSGARILLDLRAGDAPMGSELSVDGPARVKAVARGTAPIDRIELVGRRGVLASTPGDGERAEISVLASDDYVYARVTQADGEMAWSSPVFFDRSGAGPG